MATSESRDTRIVPYQPFIPKMILDSSLHTSGIEPDQSFYLNLDMMLDGCQYTSRQAIREWNNRYDILPRNVCKIIGSYLREDYDNRQMQAFKGMLASPEPIMLRAYSYNFMQIDDGSWGLRYSL